MSPETTARIVAKATAEMKPNSRSPPSALASKGAAMFGKPLVAVITVAPAWSFAWSMKLGLVETNTIAPKPMMNVNM